MVLATSLFAQEKWNYPEVDARSYELYQQKQWDDLIRYSAKAREQGIDFFYLQARTGIAFYNLKKYRKAADWFLKAWENDQSFEWLQEYLYYSLVFAGRSTEALKYAADFTPELKQKIGYANSKISRIALEGGYSFNPDFGKLQKTDFATRSGVGSNYGEGFFLKNYHFESVDVGHQLAPGFYMNHNFTIINVKREQQIDWGNHDCFPVGY